MAWIATRDTKQRRNGKPVKSYVVVWKEVARDEFGLPIPVNAARPSGRKKQKQREETYQTREVAEARRDELNAARHTNRTSALAEARKAGDLPFGHYAQAWLDSMEIKLKQGRLKQRTFDDYGKYLRRYALKSFGGKAIASITPAQCEAFLTDMVTRDNRQGDSLSPATVKHAWSGLNRVLKYALRHDAISSNPADRVDFRTNHATGDREDFEHNPLTAEQVAQVSAAVAGAGGLPAYEVYGLMVTFLAYTGLRASENSGLEVGDLEFRTASAKQAVPTAPIRCIVHVRRTKERRKGEWVTSTPKSKRSRRTVPLPPWLAEQMYAYLHDGTHPRSDEPDAPLWPTRRIGGGRRVKGQRCAVPYDWSAPMDMGGFYKTIFRPALLAVGLPATVPATDTAPATRGIRLHDLRHTFAVMQLMSGTHFMQVSKWLGHSTFTLTLNTYGDWIPEEEGGAGNQLPEPPTAVTPRQHADSNVVPLFGRRSAV